MDHNRRAKSNPAGRLIVLTDLDDTLFHSERKREPQSTDAVAAVDADGRPLSYQSAAYQTWWSALAGMAHAIVPVTGRTSYAVADRVKVLAMTADSLSIVSHGALVLQGRDIHPLWREHLGTAPDAARKTLEAAARTIDDRFEAGACPRIHCRLLVDLDVPVYLSLKSRDTSPIDPPTLSMLSDVAREFDLKLHANQRNAALRPAYACKAAAAAFVLDRLLERTTADAVIGLGDSLSDLPFLGLGHFALTPTEGQIWHVLQESAQ